MDIFVIVLIVSLFMYGLCIKDVDVDALSVEKTTAIKGVCALLVFFRHIPGYVINDVFSYRMIMIQDVIGQMIVVPFLFFSGYGLMKSISSKEGYLKHFWKKRIGKLYFEFLIIWSAFFLVDLLLKNEYDVMTIIKSLFVWESIGNSTWFMFGLMIMYMCTWICFSVTRHNEFSMLLLLILIFLYYGIMYKLKQDTHWYDTIIAFYLGMLYAYLKSKNNLVGKFNTRRKYLTSLVIFSGITIFLLILSYKTLGIDKIYQLNVLLSTISFCFFMILFFTRIEIGNNALLWLGKHSFEIYMIQRIPMMIFQRAGLGGHKLLFSIICLFSTLVLSFICKKIVRKAYIF